MNCIDKSKKTGLGVRLLIGSNHYGSHYFFKPILLRLMPGKSFLRLETAVRQAQLNDPWLAGNRHSQDAVESLSVAAGTYPDPKMTLSLVNLATDSFDFNQEAMTQLKVGVSQMFPPGRQSPDTAKTT